MSNPFASWTIADVERLNAQRIAKATGNVLPPLIGVEDECELHNQIIRECNRRGWISFHGSMVIRTARTLGEPDFTILADKGRVHFIECKTRTGKLTPEQLGIAIRAEQLGHKVNVVRHIEQFMEAIK